MLLFHTLPSCERENCITQKKQKNQKQNYHSEQLPVFDGNGNHHDQGPRSYVTYQDTCTMDSIHGAIMDMQALFIQYMHHETFYETLMMMMAG